MTADDVMTLSGGEADAVIAGYDDTTGGWTFDLFGNFWNTVQHAWGNGLNGDKSRIAILDTCPDLKRGRLGSQVTLHNLGNDSATNHGTAVALIISYIAPKAQIDHYSISVDGKARRSLFAQAMQMIAENPVDYVCLSLGDIQAMEMPDWGWAERFIRKGDLLGLAKQAKQEKVPTPKVKQCYINPCTCALADQISTSGCTILAAAGNTEGKRFCPARAASSISVGFHREEYQYENGLTFRSKQAAAGGQSSYVNYTVRQPDGVIGSSFAAPMMTGILALRDGGLPVRKLLAAKETLSILPMLHTLRERHGNEPKVLDVLDDQYFGILDIAFGETGYLWRDDLTPTEMLETGLFLSSELINQAVDQIDMFGPTQGRPALNWVTYATPYFPQAYAWWAHTICDEIGAEIQNGHMRETIHRDLEQARLAYNAALNIELDNPEYTIALQRLEVLQSMLETFGQGLLPN